MRNLFTMLLIAVLLPAKAYCQSQFTQYFDGADTIVNQNIFIDIEPSEGNIWQIGPPQKNLFHSAASVPNLLVTDTINPYPTNDTSMFSFSVPDEFGNGLGFAAIVAVQWKQKLDYDFRKDGGKIEFTLDDGLTWESAFDNPYVYNFYGFDGANLDTLGDGQYAFTGTDTTWRDIWLCFDYGLPLYYENDLTLRFTSVSDSLQGSVPREGWMIDNLLCHVTWLHTINKIEGDDVYMTVGPTPTKDRLFIETEHIEGPHFIEHMELRNTEGKCVQEWAMSPTKFFIDIGHHPTGIYFLHVKTNVKSETFKVLIEP